MILFKGLFQGRDLRRNMDHIRACPVSFQHEMVILIVSRFHRLKGVAVVGMLQGQDHGPLLISPIHIILQRHF